MNVDHKTIEDRILATAKAEYEFTKSRAAPLESAADRDRFPPFESEAMVRKWARDIWLKNAERALRAGFPEAFKDAPEQLYQAIESRLVKQQAQPTLTPRGKTPT